MKTNSETMGIGEFVGVICFVWLVLVGFDIWLHLFFFFTLLNSLAFLSVEGCKRITEGKKKIA